MQRVIFTVIGDRRPYRWYTRFGIALPVARVEYQNRINERAENVTDGSSVHAILNLNPSISRAMLCMLIAF